MWGMDIRAMREELSLSRAEFARFLGVSEATVVRWESDHATTEPKGLQQVLLRALSDARHRRPPTEVRRMVRSCGLDHRMALRSLLEAAD